MTTKSTPTPAADAVVEHPSLAAALAAFQAEVPTIRKGNEAQVRSDKGNYTYAYADLSDVTEKALPLLGKHGLSFSALPTIRQGIFVLRYALRHVSGEKVKGTYPLPSPNIPPQQLGSAITYARRYVLTAITGVAPGGDDDDAAAADAWAPRERPQTSRQRPAARPAAAKAKDAPKPDPAWLERAEAAHTKEAADEVWAALRAAVQAGEATVATTDAVAALWRSRKAADQADAAQADEAAEGAQA